MDNISHTLIGALVGECLARFSRSDMPAQPRRDLVVVLAAVGSNLPDLDLLDSGWHDRLDYLLHHRGYTHTILIALATALLLAGVAQWWLRRRHLVPSRHDWAVLGAAAVLGPALHLAMDYSNSYGVHPLWPLDNRWVYGDAIFIVEPWLWLAATPLLFTLRSRLARLLLALALGLIVVAAFGSGLVRLPVAFALAAAAGTLLVIGARCRAAVALGCGLALWLGASACFIGAGALLRARLTAFADTTWPRERLADIVLTPLPADPLCWEALLVQTHGDALIARRAMVALLPDRVPAARCPARGLRGATTAATVPPTKHTHCLRLLGDRRHRLGQPGAGCAPERFIPRLVLGRQRGGGLLCLGLLALRSLTRARGLLEQIAGAVALGLLGKVGQRGGLGEQRRGAGL